MLGIDSRQGTESTGYAVQSSTYNVHRVVIVYAVATEGTLQSVAVNDGMLFLLQLHSFTADEGRRLD